MENTNKPQWLIDAENEIKNFENSKYGKMSQREFTKSEVGRIGATAANGKGGKVTTEKYGNAAFLKEWAQDNPNQFKESTIKGGITQGNINKEKGIGLFGQTKEQLSINASNNAKVFWTNSSEEKINTRNKKASDSIKKTINEKKQNGTWNPKKAVWSDETKKQALEKRSETKLNQKEQRIKELYNAIDNSDWFTIEYATEILSTISKKGASESTARRMIHGWKEATKYYEFRKNEVNELGKKCIQWRKIQ